MRVDVILLSHGSRAPEARAYFLELADTVRAVTAWPNVTPAFMELCEPSLRAAVDAQVAQGAERIVVLPCFLHPGLHLREDVPRLMAEAQAAHPAVPLILAERIGSHPGLVHLIARCVAEALDDREHSLHTPGATTGEGLATPAPPG